MVMQRFWHLGAYLGVGSLLGALLSSGRDCGFSDQNSGLRVVRNSREGKGFVGPLTWIFS